MRNRLKKIGCYIIIIVLLPYIVTVFMNGPAVPAGTAVKETSVKVKKDDTELEMPLDEDCIGRILLQIVIAGDGGEEGGALLGVLGVGHVGPGLGARTRRRAARARIPCSSAGSS